MIFYFQHTSKLYECLHFSLYTLSAGQGTKILRLFWLFYREHVPGEKGAVMYMKETLPKVDGYNYIVAVRKVFYAR